MAPVEPLGIDAVDVAHDPGEVSPSEFADTDDSDFPLNNRQTSRSPIAGGLRPGYREKLDSQNRRQRLTVLPDLGSLYDRQPRDTEF